MKKVLSRLFVIFCLVTSCVLVAPFHIVNADIQMVSFDNTNIYTHPLVTYTYENNQYYSQIRIFFKGSYRGEAKFTLSFQLGLSGGGQYYSWAQVKAFNGEYVDCIIRNSQPVFPDTCTATVSNPDNVYRIDEYTQTFPFESYNIQVYNLQQHEYIGIDRMYNYKFNVFKITPNDTHYQFGVLYVPQSEDAYLILGINRSISSIQDVRSYINSNNLYLADYEILSSQTVDGNPWNIIKVKCHCIDGSSFSTVSFTSSDFTYMPIYFQNTKYDNVTTDFALLFGLDNRLLLAIENIQPSISTDASADDLQDTNSDFQSDATGLYTLENNFNTGMNNSLQNINVNFDIGNTLGSKFLASASWVRTQFENLTSNNPFGSVLSFSLILGIALLIIGKAIK